MSQTTFSQDQMMVIYSALTSGDSAFIQQLAKAALITATEVQRDMWNDRGNAEKNNCPDDNDVRNAAMDSAADCLAVVKQDVVDAIRTTVFTSGFNRMMTADPFFMEL